MKQDAEQESSLLYWKIEDDTTRKHHFLKQSMFFLACFLIAGFGLYQLVKEIPVAGVDSMNELEVGSVSPYYEVEEVGATKTVNDVGDENLPEEEDEDDLPDGEDEDDLPDGEDEDGIEEKFMFHNEAFDAEDLCEEYNCGPDEGSCLLLPKGDGSPSCIVDKKYLKKAVCNNDKGVWCENIYRDSDIDDFALELSVAHKEEQYKLVPGVEVALGAGIIGGDDWCDCRKKGDLEIRPKGYSTYWSKFVKPNGKWTTVQLGVKVKTVKWRCTGGGGWEDASFIVGKARSCNVLFYHDKKTCGFFKRRKSGRVIWG